MASIKTISTECSLTQEEINFLRIANLILRVAPLAVRVTFDKEFDPSQLKTTLNKARSKLEPLRKNQIINQTQWNLLFPVAVMASSAYSTYFDLTLMICLIRNLTPITVEDNLPAPTDLSEGADLSRLKYYRNMITHCKDGVLNNTRFNDYWINISQAIARLGGMSFIQKCNDLKMCNLDNNDREILTEIRNIDKSHDPIPKGLKGIHIEMIEEWEEQEVVVTSAIKHLIQMTKKENTVVAVGSSGCGKSTSIQYIALMLHRQKGFDIIPIHSPEQILQYYNSERRQVFVIDDICGKSTLDANLVNAWSRLNYGINKMLSRNMVKILSSCRTHIYHDRLFKNVKFMASSVCNLTADFRLTKSEELSIAKVFMNIQEVTRIQNKAFEKYDFFPLLCKLFTKQPIRDVDTFFSNPVQVLKDDLKLLIDASDQRTFATLFLFIVYDNEVNENLFLKTSGMHEVLQHLNDNFEFQGNFSIQVVQSEIEKLNETYLTKSKKTYSFLHDKLFDLFVSFSGQHKFDLVLNIAHCDVVRNRFIFERLMTKDTEINEHFIKIPAKKEQSYFERLLKDIKKGLFKTLFFNKQLKYESFRQQVIEYLEGKINIYQTVSEYSTDIFNLLLFSMVRQGLCDMLKLLISGKFDVNCVCQKYNWIELRQHFNVTPLYVASENDFSDIVEILLKHKANPDIICITVAIFETALYVASEKGYIDTVKLLLKHEANPNIKSRGKITPLYIASSNGHAPVVKLLLSSKADPNIGSWGNVTPLLEATKNGHITVVKLLLEYKADTNLSDKYGRIPLDIAAEEGNTDMVSLLLRNKSEINHRNEDNVTPLLRALFANKTETAKVLLKYRADCNIANIENITPFYVALDNDYSDIVNKMLELDLGVDMKKRHYTMRFYVACKHGDLRAVKSLFEKQVDVNSNVHYKRNRSALHVACGNGHIEVANILLRNKARIDQRDKYKATPLYCASSSGHTDVVKLLLNQNANANVTNKFGNTPLFIASRKGHTEIVMVLLKYQCNPNTKNRNGQTPLYGASREGHTDIVKILINHTEINPCKTDNIRALIAASYNAKTDVINEFLKKGFNPDTCDTTKDTLLNRACYYGHIDVVKLLLQYKCDINICNEKSSTPLHSACYKFHIQVVRLLLDHVYISEIEPTKYINSSDTYGDTCLCIACSKECHGKADIVKLLLLYKADPNISNRMNETPLLIAVRNSYTNIVNILLENKADPNICDISNTTPIYEAITRYGIEVVKVLLKYNSDLNCYCGENETPLFKAAKEGFVDIVELLLEHKCHPICLNNRHETPLFIAVSNDYFEVVKLLLTLDNCGINISNNENETPIFKASCKGNTDIVKLLLEKNSNLNITNDRNESPLLLASSNGHVDVVELLIDHKSNLNGCNDANETPLLKAVIHGHIDIVELLLHRDCDANIVNKQMCTPLMLASCNGNMRIVQLLLDHGCKLDVCDTINVNPLYCAAYHGYTEIVKIILNHRSKHNIRVDTITQAYNAALYNGHKAVAMLLMESNHEL